ncbi:CDP-glycerol glycerophosphotransferase family protein [Vibrio vulnificus]|uniref:CDP-glycerol glycerophosphotransferase family protein n=1 Tax=Vibrio vulnificus TaxID=672 RepID=UPI0028DE18C2|nr:CDP-glycerol glycerophosphotransferase family protein [Vibrio vulnificus]MDT8823878.1 CDP-glycerol glycerophosphotransferase family protein [Vibrio vulnificus]
MKKTIKLFILWPLYYLSGFMKRDKKIWLFGSYKNRFNDNSKYAFLRCSASLKNIECYWITDDEKLIKKLRLHGLKAEKRRSIRGVILMLRAGVYFVSSYATDIMFWTSRNVYYVNLWHGMPLKEIEYDINSGPLADKYNSKRIFDLIRYRLFEPECFKLPNLMFAPSEFWRDVISKAFRLSKDHIVLAGAPRTDILFNSMNKLYGGEFYEEGFQIESLIKDDRKKIILMPTFRDSGKDYFIESGINLQILNDVSSKYGLVFYIKLHPSDRFSKEKENYENVKIITDSISDIYPYLPYFDLLITDYSSIYLDYILTEKKVLFFPFDLDDYRRNSRGMYFEYNDFTPGEKVINFDELINYILSEFTEVNEPGTKEFINKYFDGNTHNNSDAIYKNVMLELKIKD